MDPARASNDRGAALRVLRTFGDRAVFGSDEDVWRSSFEAIVKRRFDRAVSALVVVVRGPAARVEEVVDVKAEEEEPDRAAKDVETRDTARRSLPCWGERAGRLGRRR
jgi:hypothetical protein